MTQMLLSQAPKLRVVIFDLGNVLIQWDPRFLYRKIFPDTRDMEYFLTEVCSPEWNLGQDRGRSFAEAIAEATKCHPTYHSEIAAWFTRFDEMIPGAIEGTIKLLEDLKARHIPCYALSNWSAETFYKTRPRFAFLNLFDGLMISGEERLIKPDPAFYHLICQRYSFQPDEAVFIDDSAANIAAAIALGFQSILFKDANQTRAALIRLGLL
ncbi:MAG: HAD family phosphatase [Alphaproteobacteria bacterium]